LKTVSAAAYDSELLRLSTVGSVDDGKSTLIGKLLFDTKQIMEDQLAAVERASKAQGADYVNLALLTDGLRAEREQGITIDVAYRYFSTPRRRFIIADTPGHVQYTRNMATGASSANVALILVDVRKGISEQSRRHALIASLLGVPRFVICINKMDLVDFNMDKYEEVRQAFVEFATRLNVTDMVFIPLSALYGDNIVKRSPRMPWYDGPSLLYYLENVYIAGDRNLIAPRFPVQYVIRPFSNQHHDYRAYAGEVQSGVFRVGDEIMVLPSGFKSKIKAIDSWNGPLDSAFPFMSVAFRLEDDLDVSRGDMICRPNNQPNVGQTLDAMLCWLDETPMQPGKKYFIKHTTKTAKALVETLRYRLEINSLSRTEATSLSLNDVGRVVIRTTTPLFYDPYLRNRYTGSFILIDEASHHTCAAGMIRW